MACNITDAIRSISFVKQASLRDRPMHSRCRIHPPAAQIAELHATAASELAAFYQAVLRQHGPVQANLAAQDWVEVLETMEWPANGARPDWRKATIAAASRLATRLLA